MRFSLRTNWKVEANELAKCLEALRRKGVQILDLTESNPTRLGFRYLTNPAILSALGNSKNMAYEPSPKGLKTAREAVAKYYQDKNIDVNPDHIFLTASTSEAYSCLFRLLANPGERILFLQPSYPLFEFLTELNDVKLDHYPLIYNDGWHTEFSGLFKKIQPNTKAIVLVNPNNPTGSFLKKHELPQLTKICKYNNLSIISDEVFSDYVFEKSTERVQSLAVCHDILTFSLGGISKTLGLPQMKLAWIAVTGPQQMVEEAIAKLEVITDTYLSVNTPVQNALPEWLALKSQIQDEILNRISENKKFLSEKFQGKNSCELLHSEGGWYAILKMPGTKNGEEWVLEFLERDHVLVHPGYFFDFSEDGYTVLSLIVPPATFREAVSRIFARTIFKISTAAPT